MWASGPSRQVTRSATTGRVAIERVEHCGDGSRPGGNGVERQVADDQVDRLVRRPDSRSSQRGTRPTRGTRDATDLAHPVEATDVHFEHHPATSSRCRRIVHPPRVEDEPAERHRAPDQPVDPFAAVVSRPDAAARSVDVSRHLVDQLGRGGFHRRFVERVEAQVAGEVGDRLLATLRRLGKPVESRAHLDVGVLAERVAMRESSFEDREDHRAEFVESSERAEHPHQRRLESGRSRAARRPRTGPAPARVAVGSPSGSPARSASSHWRNDSRNSWVCSVGADSSVSASVWGGRAHPVRRRCRGARPHRRAGQRRRGRRSRRAGAAWSATCAAPPATGRSRAGSRRAACRPDRTACGWDPPGHAGPRGRDTARSRCRPTRSRGALEYGPSARPARPARSP